MTTLTANEAWMELGQRLLIEGQRSAPRGQETYERLFAEIKFDMNYPVCYHQNRGLNYSFSAAEAYAITHGVADEHFLVQYNKNMAQFSDDGLIFNGAYGPPFHNQVMYVVNNLIKDRDSRQAVLTIWRPNPVRSADLACTLALQFLLRDGFMHCKVTMRSSDIWLGIPYDFMNFTVMTLRILTLYNELTGSNFALGTMHWSAGSSHLYAHNVSQLNKVLMVPTDKTLQPMPERCYSDWRFVTDSLIACMNKTDDQNKLWKIRP